MPSTGLLTKPATKSALLTVTNRGIDAEVFEPVYLGLDCDGPDPWNRDDYVFIDPHGLVPAAMRDEYAKPRPDGGFEVYGYIAPCTFWSTWGSPIPRSNQRSIARDNPDRSRNLYIDIGPDEGGAYEWGMATIVKPEHLLHDNARMMRELTALHRGTGDTGPFRVYDMDDLYAMPMELFQSGEFYSAEGQRAGIEVALYTLLRWPVDSPLPKAYRQLLRRASDEWIKAEVMRLYEIIHELRGCEDEADPLTMFSCGLGMMSAGALSLGRHTSEIHRMIAQRLLEGCGKETPEQQTARWRDSADHRAWHSQQPDFYEDECALCLR